LLQHAGNSGCRRARDRRRHEVTFAPYPAHTTGRTRHARPAGSTCQCCFGAAPALRAATAGTVYNIHTASGHISDQIRPPIAHRQKLKNGRPSPGQLQQAPSRCHLSLHPSATPAPESHRGKALRARPRKYRRRLHSTCSQLVDAAPAFKTVPVAATYFKADVSLATTAGSMAASAAPVVCGPKNIGYSPHGWIQ
jgi:hypothetical protein